MLNQLKECMSILECIIHCVAYLKLCHWQILCRGRSYLEIGEDGSDVFFEAHVNHPISLIQSQVAADVQTHHLLLQQVHQSAGSCDHHVDPTITINEISSDGKWPKNHLLLIFLKYIIQVRNAFCLNLFMFVYFLALWISYCSWIAHFLLNTQILDNRQKQIVFHSNSSLILTVLLPPSAPWQTFLQCRGQCATEALPPPPAACSSTRWCRESASPTLAGTKGRALKSDMLSCEKASLLRVNAICLE